LSILLPSSPLCHPTLSMKLSPTQSILQPHIRRIDVHHHFFPTDLNKEKSNIHLGWKTPLENIPWTPEKSLQAMDAMNIDFAILSLPAISGGSVNEENRLMARKRNEFAAAVCSTYPNRFGFFATPPFLDDVEGVYLTL
jgi:predicted TIM-barrel fold metal-dependent hydrolase